MQPDGFGYRARIGLVYIASSVACEPEFHRLCPDGVSVHTTRIHLGKVAIDELTNLGAADHEQHLVQAVSLLAEAPLQSIIFGCTSGSFVGGTDYDRRLIAEMTECSGGIPVTTTTTASVKALRALHASRIVIVAPYTEEVTKRAVLYFSGNGFDVVGSKAMGIEDDTAIGRVSPEAVYETVRKMDRRDADGFFISCTNLRSIAVIGDLEADLGKPVVSATQASFWDGLRLAGITDGIKDYGQLLLT